ncbi:phosphopantetheine-binding protein [Streptomyces gelaticus]|uniref:acyl carrier protein n=1 Tax=Streptomyces gelaticus TaxID=285446 RepID=UPI00379739F7
MRDARSVQVHGITVDWTAVFANTGAQRATFPTYAFQRTHYWPAPPAPGTFFSPPHPRASPPKPSTATKCSRRAGISPRNCGTHRPPSGTGCSAAPVAQHVAAVLGHGSAEAVEKDTNFLEQGFDSLTALRMRNNLQKALGVTLSPTLLFDHSTPVRLARHLAERLLGSEVGAEGDEAADETPQPGANGLLGLLFRHSRDIGKPVEYTELLINLLSRRGRLE